MPGTGPVYQPTTVSYEQQNHWSGRPGFLHNSTFLRIRCLQWLTLVLALTGVAAGLVMLISASTELTDTNTREIEFHQTTPEDATSSRKDLILIVIGSLLLILGLILLISYFLLTWRRRVLPWLLPGVGGGMGRKEMVVGGGGPVTAGVGMNPSTDLLVASQYGMEMSRPPGEQEEEQRKLMPSGGGDGNNCLLSKTLQPTDTNQPDDDISFPATRKSSWVSLDEKQFTSDEQTSWRTRIQRKASQRKRAPLAAAEESLRSSFDSMFLGNYDSELDSERESNASTAF